jgi:arylsulfatase A-like enzyme
MAENRHVRDAIFKDAPSENASTPPYPEGWDDWENAHRHRGERVVLPSDFYGLDEVDLTINHSDSCSGHYYQWLLERGVDPTKLQGKKNALPFESTTQQIWRTALPEEVYPTRYVSSRTVDYLEGRKSHPDVPFVAFCSYPDPHHPFTPPGRYFDMYDPKDIPLPESFHDPHTDSLKHYKMHIAQRGKQVAFMAPFAPTQEQYGQMAAAEYGMISMIDDGVGEVMAALDRSGQADDTIVIFTSDHGDMFGDHGMMLKASMHYEGCIRVPLVIASPGREAGVCDSLVSTLDIAQTVLDLADCPEYEGMQGNSIVSLLERPEGSVRDHVLVEEDEMFDLALLGQGLRMRTLVTKEGRVTLYRGSEAGELYDLQSDRGEMNNLFAKRDGRALRAHMVERLARLQMEYADSSPVPSYMA